MTEDQYVDKHLATLGFKPVEKSGESLEEQALSYFKKANPIIAEDEYYTKNPERSMTYRAALWGLKQGEDAIEALKINRDENKQCALNNFKLARDLEKQIAKAEAAILQAIGFLREAKAKHYPHTTNSLVDDFITKYTYKPGVREASGKEGEK